MGHLWNEYLPPLLSYLWWGKGCRKLRMFLAQRDLTQLRTDCRKLGPSCIWGKVGIHRDKYRWAGHM
jgi:hypothetical protein